MKILDLIMKVVFYTIGISSLLVLFYIAGKMMYQDTAMPGWLKILAILFSISGSYLFFKNRYES
jgi:hypothetical protein